MKKIFVFICFLMLTQSYSQEKIYKYYVHLNNYDDPPTFENINGLLVYDGTNTDLASFLSSFLFISFNQAFPSSLRPLNLEVFILETTSEKLMTDLVNSFLYIFKTFTELINDTPVSHWDSTLNRFVPNFTGMQYFYPASYNGVIAVSGIAHKYLANDPVVYNGFSPLGFHVASYIKDSFSPNVNVSDFNTPIGLR